MTMRITYPDGSTEIIPEAIRVDQQNFQEGMYDFYDKHGVLLKRIDINSNIEWELVDEPMQSPEEQPLFLRDTSEGRKGNAQDEKDETAE
jgi:hypothetical protein